ncbi:MAG: NAD(+) kinase [Nitriliruptorales bacterium]|nr:NAD(+) kinase [Nitriliruptorales bacterium]
MSGNAMTPSPNKVVGLVVHGGRPTACEAATAAARQLAETGAQVVGVRGDAWSDASAELREPGAFGAGLDVAVVIGGDGTFLRAAYLVRDQGVPLLGVNLGRLGFLSEIEVMDIPAMVQRVVAGDYQVEERMTLSVEVRDEHGGLIGHSWALNEASIERTVPQRLIVLEVLVGERTFASLPTDAVVCATPTGSTAYAFSARGPILSPLVDAIVVVPVAPHSLFDRTIVVDPNETVTVRPVDGDNACVVSTDGRESLPVPNGGSVRVLRGESPVRMARLVPFDFYGRVRQKFGLR